MSDLKKIAKYISRAIIEVIFFFLLIVTVFKVSVILLPYQDMDTDKLEFNHSFFVLVQDVKFKGPLLELYKDAVILVASGEATLIIPVTRGFKKIEGRDRWNTYRYKAVHHDNGDLVVSLKYLDRDYEVHSRYIVRDGKIIQASSKDVHAFPIALHSFCIAIFLWLLAHHLAARALQYLRKSRKGIFRS